MLNCLQNKPKEGSFSQQRSIAGLISVLLLLAACYGVVLLYKPSLANPYYILDSRELILCESDLEMHEFRYEGLKDVLIKNKHHGIRRGLPRLTFAFQIGSHGHHMFFLRLFNVALHLLLCVLIFLICRKTLLFPAFSHMGQSLHWIPLTTAIVWAVHPVHIQSVAYLMQRATIMAALFSLLSLYLFLQLRCRGPGFGRKILIALCATCWIMACWCKLNAVILPVVMYFYDWFVVRDLKKRSRWETLIVAVVVTILGLAFVIYALWYPKEGNPLPYEPMERGFTQLRIIWRYLLLVVYAAPSQLNFDVYNDYPISTSLFNPPITTLALLGIMTLIWGSVMVARRLRLLSLGVLLFFISLSIESSFLMIELVKENRLYFPFIFLLFGLVATFFEHVRHPLVRVAAPLVVVVVLGFWLQARMHVWTDPILLHEDTLAKSPGNERNTNELGRIYSCHERHADALPLFKKVIKSATWNPSWFRDVRTSERAVEAQKKLAKNPNDWDAHYKLSESLGPRGFYCKKVLGPRLDIYKRLLNQHLPEFKTRRTEHY